jgi:predicted ribosomally synthesized peptide with nif11-like leader
MSEEQLAALLAKLKDDEGLQEKLKGAADLDAVLAIAKDAGFEISKAAWLRYEAEQTIELSDEELEGVAGGGRSYLLEPQSRLARMDSDSPIEGKLSSYGIL